MLRRCEAFQGLHHGNWANNPFVLIELQLVRSPFKTIVTPFQRLTCPRGLWCRLQPGGSATVSNKVEQDPTLPGPIDASVKAKQADQQLQLKSW